jgi:CO dehydrogenase maturation factor
MKLAIVGKGGVGKTSISGTLARLLARRGRPVLAIDGDPNPNLALTLGVSPERMESMPTLSADLVEYTEQGGYRLTKTLAEICASHSLEAPDGVTLLALKPEQKAGEG